MTAALQITQAVGLVEILAGVIKQIIKGQRFRQGGVQSRAGIDVVNQV